MQNFEAKLQRLLTSLSGRGFAAVALSMVMASVIFWASSLTNQITIYDKETTRLKYTFEQNPINILEDSGVVTMSADLVHFSGISEGRGEISITRAFPVTVAARSKTQTVNVTGGTVGSLLNDLGFSFDSNDIVSPSPSKPLEENTSIRLQEVTYTSRTQTAELPHKQEIRPSSLLKQGEKVTLKAGADGLKTQVYEERRVDGSVTGQRLVSESVDKAPVTEVILQGAKAAVSPLDFGVPLGSDGAPLKYKSVEHNQVATGYNAGSYAWGASGKTLSAGYVAVHPDKIPYGTKLYIASEDGSFVYGFAIAADTGTALLADMIDVDLYYDTYKESCLNGRKSVSIYVL